jgi:hypothetical protein
MSMCAWLADGLACIMDHPPPALPGRCPETWRRSLSVHQPNSSNPRNFRISELARHFRDMRAMSAETALRRREF